MQMITQNERDRLEELVQEAIYTSYWQGRATGRSDYMDKRQRAVDDADALLTYINSLTDDAESLAARVEAEMPDIRKRLENLTEVTQALLEELSDAVTVLDSTPKGGDAS